MVYITQKPGAYGAGLLCLVGKTTSLQQLPFQMIQVGL